MNSTASVPLTFQLVGALHAVEARLEQALEPLGLSLAKFGVLARLVAAGEPVTLGALAEMRACVRSNITQLVDRLEVEKLVARAADPRDRRSIRAELTTEGRRRHDAAAKALQAAELDLLSRLPAAQRESLPELLAALGGCR